MIYESYFDLSMCKALTITVSIYVWEEVQQYKLLQHHKTFLLWIGIF